MVNTIYLEGTQSVERLNGARDMWAALGVPNVTEWQQIYQPMSDGALFPTGYRLVAESVEGKPTVMVFTPDDFEELEVVVGRVMLSLGKGMAVGDEAFERVVECSGLVQAVHERLAAND